MVSTATTQKGHTPQTPWTGTPNNMHLASDRRRHGLDNQGSLHLETDRL
jgi:hypothetical protein